MTSTTQAPKPTCPVCSHAVPARTDGLTLPCNDCLLAHQRKLRRQQAAALASDPLTRNRRIQALAAQGCSRAAISRAVGLSTSRIVRILHDA